MGLAFQLQDDLLDVYGDPKTFKKKLGGDIVDNKKTFMLINAYQRANAEQKAELDKWMKTTDCDANEKIAAVTHIYNIVGISQLVQQKIEKLFSQALACLEKVKVDSQKKTELRHFADKLLGRQY
jgi:geranylgeranyl diphosphate synthase type II